MNPDEQSTGPSNTSSASRWQHPLWAGQDTPALLWRQLIVAVIALMAVNLLFIIALTTIRWPMPLKLVGIVTLLVAASVLFLGLRAVFRVIRQLGLKRLITALVIVYLLAVVILGLLVPTGEQGLNHWLASAASVARLAGGAINGLARAAISAPADVHFAANGRRAPIRVPGVQWVDGVPPTPIAVQVIASGAVEVVDEVPIVPDEISPMDALVPNQEWAIGNSVQVSGTDGAPLRARQEPSIDAPIVARFPIGSRLQITDGPQSTDGRVWWKVRGDNGEGWCAAEFLALP